MIESDKILAELSQGREEAFQLLFYTYYRDLVTYSCSIVSNLHLAEDIVQEFFVGFWQKKKFHGGGITSLESYLYFSVKNASLNALRDRRRRLGKEEEITRQHEMEDKSAELFGEENEVDFSKIYGAIRKLPPARKKIFVLCCLKNLKYKEVADIMNISVNTVKVQMGRAFKFLRENSFIFCNTFFCFWCL